MKPFVFGAVSVLSVLAFAAPALADVPAGYMGTPYKGTATSLPGRVDFENFDVGGYNVGFKTEHHLGGAPIGCSGGDYRTDADQPTMCKTNQGTEVDKYADGTLYPSAANPVSYYVGAVRPSDWIQVTVNVKTAGTYKLSSTLASDADKIDLTLQFNGVEKLKYQVAAGGGYHKWVPAPQFAELDAGVQVLRLICNREHVNADYIQFSLVTPGGLDDGSTGSAGAGGGGAGAAGSAGGGSAGAAGAGSGGTAGSGVAGDTTGGTSSAGASIAGASAAGNTSTSAGASSAGASSAGAPSTLPPGNSSAADANCSCRISAPVSKHPLQMGLLALVAGVLGIARARRRRTRM